MRAFGRTLPAAVYTRRIDAGEFRLTESSGGPVSRYGLRPAYPRSGRSPVADACRTGRPLWLDAAGYAGYREDGTEPERGDVALGALPLGGTDSGPVGCLIVVDETGDGFDEDRRTFLELYAEHIGERLEGGDTPQPWSVRGRALESVSAGSFALGLRTGRVKADQQALELMDIPPDGFDGRVETLLAHTVPDDLPALMSAVEPGPAAAGSRELEFRVQHRSGELRWLHLRCRTDTEPDGTPKRVLGVLVVTAHLRPDADEVSRLQRLSATLATAVSVRDVGEVAVAAMRELDATRVALAESEADRLVVTTLDPPEHGAWPPSWHAEWPHMPAGAQRALEATLRQGRISLWPPGTAPDDDRLGIGPGGLAVLPLPADGQGAGLCLVGWERPHEFGPEERFLLTAAARLIGQALARARASDAEHELAAMLQRSLLPRTLPSLPGAVATARYLPATVGLDVGGDWYDVIPLSDRHVALVIGDVQGHSAAAATIMGQIRTAIRAYAVEGHSPDVVISHANRLLVGMETDLFATCCFVAMDMEEGDTWFVRAGHLPPLLRHPDGSTREVEVEGGPPLGIVPDPAYPMTVTGLDPGTVLALMTDGLAESASLPIEIGLRRVHEALSATDPADLGRLADVLLGGASRRDDDVALLLVRFDGMAVKPRRAEWSVWRLPDAVGHARRFTARMLRSWQVADGVDAVLLLVSELVTNALTHTQGQVRLELALSGERLRVAVSDSSPRTPVKSPQAGWAATGGRGLLLVEAVSAAWGSVPLSGGKQVWAEIPVPPREPEPAAPESEKRH